MLSKYRAVRTNGFASKKEAARHQELLLLEKSGEIRQLVTQKRFLLEVNGKRICSYVADFHYYDVSKFRWVTEDTKGFRTPIYKLKRELMKAIHGIEVFET